PFDQVVSELDIVKDQSRNALFEVMLVLQNATGEAAYELQYAVEGIKIEEYHTDHIVSKFDLTLSFEERKGLKGRLEYNSDLFSEENISRIIDHFRRLLEKAVEEPLKPLAY